ncbi:MAG: aminotransferase class V-fold PLP-dependent enzyme, partial [Ignavibacteriales bacterium]|nr:aminotransferase class V-fold PLP-dependent enzyme [Ignavibacteriales bacterium]
TPKTRLIAISLVQFLTGFRADVEMIGNLCREKNIIFSVDAIQGAGVVKIDAQKSKIDFLTGGTQKWLNGLEGLSYIYLTEELQSQLNQKFVGWLSVEDAWNFLDYNLLLKNDATRFENGTLCSIGVNAINSSLELFEQVGYAEIEKQIINNTKYFVNSLIKIGIEPIQNKFEEKNLSGIVSIKPNEPQELFEELTREKIMCSLREKMIRFSPHYYNTKDEIDKVVDLLKNNK